jgi:hypothetical protein
MKSMMHKAALAILFGFAAGSAGAAVTVTYVAPEKFSDVPRLDAEREDTLKDLSRHFAKLGDKLAPGQDLRIDVLDLDMAGRLIPGILRGKDARVLSNLASDGPGVTLRYSLLQDKQVVYTGEVTLLDPHYLEHRPRYWDNVPLRYEKTMIDAWFERSFPQPARQASR